MNSLKKLHDYLSEGKRLEDAVNSPKPWRNDDGILQALTEYYDYGNKYFYDLGKIRSGRNTAEFWKGDADFIADARTRISVYREIIEKQFIFLEELSGFFSMICIKEAMIKPSDINMIDNVIEHAASLVPHE